MANNGYFKCEKCGHLSDKKLIPDHVKVSEERCPKCDGRMIKT